MMRAAILIGSLLFSVPSNVKALNNVELIANTSVPVNTLTQSEAAAIFNGKITKWRDGTDIKVYVLPSSNPTTIELFTAVLGILPSTYWQNLLFNASELNVPFVPNISSNEIGLYNAIDCTPGAIGYISVIELDFYHKKTDAVKIIDLTN
jgi:ABC-type phosphate transport system substrate-binding protein